MTDRLIFGEVVDKLLRAAQNGQRLHLDPEHCRAIIESRVYPLLTEIQAEELTKLWRDEPPKESRSRGGKAKATPPSKRSESSGSGPESSEATGASVGMTDQLVGSAASRQALAAVERAIRHGRQSKRLRTISPPIPDRPSRRSHPRPVSQSS